MNKITTGKAYAPLPVTNCDSSMLSTPQCSYRKLSHRLSASSLHHIDLLPPWLVQVEIRGTCLS